MIHKTKTTSNIITVLALAAFIFTSVSAAGQCYLSCSGFNTFSHNYNTVSMTSCGGAANGSCSFAAGPNAFANGNASMALGESVNADAFASAAIGTNVQVNAGDEASIWMGEGIASNNDRTLGIGWNGDVLLYGSGNNERIGIREVNPDATLHVEGSTGAAGNYSLRVENTNQRPIIVAEDNSRVGIRNDNPSATMEVRGISTSSADYAMRVTDGASTPNDILVARNDQRVGVRVTNPDAALHVQGINAANTDYAFRATDGNGDDILRVRNDGNVAIGSPMSFNDALNVEGDACKTGGGTWSSCSDRRLKKDIKPFEGGLDIINKMKPVRYKYNGKLGFPSDKEFVGVIAQDVMEYAPYMIEKENFGEGGSYYTYDPNALFYILVNSVQEQQEQIEKLHNELATEREAGKKMEEEINTLKQRFDKVIGGSGGSNDDFQSDNKKSITLKDKGMERALLFQNTPNPFKGSTTIKYYLPTDVNTAQLIVISTDNGKLLKQVQLKRNGFGEVNVNTENVAAGTYSYALILDGEQKLSRQMVVAQ